MSREIIININEANKAQKYQNENELFQQDAFEDVTKILKSHSFNKDNNEIVNCRFHDTIFIDGDRGVGKTAFMVNIEKYYNDNKDGNDNSYIFLNPIDPTLLEHTEKFLSIVLAKVLEMVNTRLEKVNVDNNLEEKYYNSLEKLSKSLSSIKTLPDDLGIEEIASYKSSLKLEQNTHHFFSVVCDMFGVNALVMLIDDVDMAFDKGFDVLEVVRKYLASPFLIPIVAGDKKLYREIVETQFMSKIEFQNDIKSLSYANNIFKNDENEVFKEESQKRYNEKKELLDKLVEQYLTKLFPNEYHIKLKSIFTILKENEVNVKFDDTLAIPYTEIKDFEIRFINLGINQTKFTYQVFSDNTRDLVQYLYSKREIYKEIFGNKNYFSDDYKFKESHQKYTPQNVMDKYDAVIIDFISSRKKLNKRSREITSLFYEYHEGKQKELSRLTNNDVMAYQNGTYNIYKAFLGNVFKDSKLSIEKGKEKISIHYKSFPNIDTFDYKGKFTADIFVHHNYYNESNKTKKHLFAGKFIELLYFSLSFDKDVDSLTLKEESKKSFYMKDEWIPTKSSLSFEELKEKFIGENLNITTTDSLIDNNFIEAISNYFNCEDLFNESDIDTLNRISYKIPFNSEFSKNKNFKKENYEATEDDETNIIIKHSNENLNQLLLEILIWKKMFITHIKLNSLSVYETMHKFFNNLDILKEKSDSKDFKDEDALTFIRRIVFIFINSVAYFENTNIRVAETNISVSNKFSLDTILKNTNAYTQNIKPLLEKNSLTKALFYHPIISYILSDKNELASLTFKKIKTSTELFEQMIKDIGSFGIDQKITILKKVLEEDFKIIKEIHEIPKFKKFVISASSDSNKEKQKTFKALQSDLDNKLNNDKE